MSANPQIASTIIAQLGRGTLAMLGAFNLVDMGNGLGLKIKGSRRVNYIGVTLAADDTYTLTFKKLTKRGLDVADVADLDGVYADSLHRVIEAETGLSTRL